MNPHPYVYPNDVHVRSTSTIPWSGQTESVPCAGAGRNWRRKAKQKGETMIGFRRWLEAKGILIVHSIQCSYPYIYASHGSHNVIRLNNNRNSCANMGIEKYGHIWCYLQNKDEHLSKMIMIKKLSSIKELKVLSTLWERILVMELIWLSSSLLV